VHHAAIARTCSLRLLDAPVEQTSKGQSRGATPAMLREIEIEVVALEDVFLDPPT